MSPPVTTWIQVSSGVNPLNSARSFADPGFVALQSTCPHAAPVWRFVYFPVLNITMPDFTGIEASRELRQYRLESDFVFLTVVTKLSL
jgi:hypothetical protein